ncbi:flavin reductase family protein [Paracoccus pacificus]|uniref:Flavin reductase family protein n=1 Tax=Paracoccus pacificus TaxID=1463598 RepID=A0ABW4R3Q8_9RHOB
MTEFEPRALRDAFGCFMTGVTVVTTTAADGRPLGFTANSFSSVSMDPPLLLVSIARSSRNYAQFAQAQGFAVNVLAERQKDVSATFARPVEDRFADLDWHTGTAGSPIIEGASAWFDCAVWQVVEAGDHAILIGQIKDFAASQEPGLGYYRGAYITPAQTAAQLPAGPDVVVSVILECGGRVLLLDDGEGGYTLPETRIGRDGLQSALNRLLSRTADDAEPGEIYAIYEGRDAGQQHIVFRCPAATTLAQEGRFVTLDPDTLKAVADPAVRSMLSRLAEESKLGNYGVYFGSHESGRVSGKWKGTA